jgi:DNA-binding transcriptional LysR family regulator
MDLRQIDLNLLVVFNQLLLDRRVSTSAEKLGLTQPAVSNALKRLRTLLNDELFVRTARGMEPTPYAMHLAEPVGQALSSLQNAFSQRDTFDPTTSSRTFTLAMTDIGEIYFMPPLLEALARLAPNIKICPTCRRVSSSAGFFINVMFASFAKDTPRRATPFPWRITVLANM